MKKFFQTLALASLAISGILVSSCKVEEIKTTFDPTAAVVTITVSAFDAMNANANISNDPSLVLSASSNANIVIKKDGNVLTIEGGPAIQEQIVTIDAEYKGNKGQTTVNVNALLAGGKASYPATVIVGTAPKTNATAYLQVSVWDNESETDITAEANLKLEGVPAAYKAESGKTAGTFVITGEDGIASFPLDVIATYGNATGKTTITIKDIAKGSSDTYTGFIAIGEAKRVPAVANIMVSVVDGILKKDITASSEISAMLEDGSTATVKVDGNIVTVTAGEDLEIAAQEVIISAKYGELEDGTIVTLPKIDAGGVGFYAGTVIINDPAKYYPEKVGEEIIGVKVGTFFSTHDLHTFTHDYSHATTGHGHGTGEWLYNESEFILNTTVDYENEYGTIGTSTEFARGCTATDMKMIVYFGEALYGKKAVKEPAQLKIQVSAFAMYSAYCTKTTKKTYYNVYRRDKADDIVKVGTITVASISTQAEYCEAAIPGHEGHYHYGHGHDDVHGYSSNAGGGIFFGE